MSPGHPGVVEQVGELAQEAGSGHLGTARDTQSPNLPHPQQLVGEGSKAHRHRERDGRNGLVVLVVIVAVVIWGCCWRCW